MAGDRYGLDKLGSEGIPIRRLLDGGVPVALSTDGVPYSIVGRMGSDRALGRGRPTPARRKPPDP